MKPFGAGYHRMTIVFLLGKFRDLFEKDGRRVRKVMLCSIITHQCYQSITLVVLLQIMPRKTER